MNSINTQQRSIIIGSFLAVGIAAVSFLTFEAMPAAVSCVLGWTMLAIAIIDARHFMIPDVLSLPALPAGLGAVWILAPKEYPSLIILEHMVVAGGAAGVFYLIRLTYSLVRKREGLGLGDVKLAAVAGAWTGLQGISYVILLSCLGAFCFIIVLHIFGHRQLASTTALPFGTFLAPSIWLVWAIGAMGALPTIM